MRVAHRESKGMLRALHATVCFTTPRPHANVYSPLLCCRALGVGSLISVGSRQDTARCEGTRLALRGRRATAAAADQRLKEPRRRNARHKVTLNLPTTTITAAAAAGIGACAHARTSPTLLYGYPVVLAVHDPRERTPPCGGRGHYIADRRPFTRTSTLAISIARYLARFKCE